MANKQMTLLAPDDFVLKTAKFSLSTADILSLDSVPKQIVPAVTGKILQPIGGVLYYTAGATPFTIAPSNYFSIGDSAVTSNKNAAYAIASNFIDQATNQKAGISSFDNGGTPNGDDTSEGLYIILTAAASLGNGSIEGFIYYAEAKF